MQSLVWPRVDARRIVVRAWVFLGGDGPRGGRCFNVGGAVCGSSERFGYKRWWAGWVFLVVCGGGCSVGLKQKVIHRIYMRATGPSVCTLASVA